MQIGKWMLCLVMIAVLAVLSAGCTGQQTGKEAAPPAAVPVELTVSAAISMKDALAELQNIYQSKNPQVKITYNLGASGSLQKQIEEGAPADIFISAAAKQMNELEKKKLIKPESRKNLLENQLVLIVGKNSTLELTSFADLQKPAVQHFAIGAPESVPAGQYTQQVLQKLNLFAALQEKTVQAKDVRAVLNYVETGNAEAGAVYKTDAASSDKVKIVCIAPPDTHEPIVYPMAVIAASKQPQAAAEFTAFLSSPEAQTIFAKYGFSAGK